MDSKFKESILKRIAEIEVPKDIAECPYIPLGKGVLLKKDSSDGMRMNKAGILVPVASQKFQNQARIIALGPDCSDYLKVGLSVKYNYMTDIATDIDGEDYVLNNEHSIEGIVLDAKRVNILHKAPSANELRREEASSLVSRAIKLKREEFDNNEDKRIDLSKNRKKTIFSKTK